MGLSEGRDCRTALSPDKIFFKKTALNSKTKKPGLIEKRSIILLSIEVNLVPVASILCMMSLYIDVLDDRNRIDSELQKLSTMFQCVQVILLCLVEHE